MAVVGQKLVLNNWLDGQYAEVTVLDENALGDRVRVQFPDGVKEWLHRDVFDTEPEEGFRKWDGTGSWAT